jgi:hypothetical protein
VVLADFYLFINALKGNTMGMRVDGSSAGWSSYQTSAVSGWQQRQQGMKDLMSALKSGDLTSAQQAFAGIKSTAGTGNSALTKIGDALQAGDLAGAQQAAQAMHTRHGGHHHAPEAAQAASSTSTSTDSTANTTTDATTAFNSFIQNLEAALEQQGQTTAGANGQGSFNMPPPPAAAAASTAVANSPTTQDFLGSRGAAPVSNAQLEASLESLIQQMSGLPGASSDASTVATNTSSANGNLQSSFANLIGALGGQSSTASVTNFLQSLDNNLKSMDAAGGLVNTAA